MYKSELAQQIDAWREANPGVRITTSVVRELRGAGANLYGAYLYGADLYGADLRGADLYGADLYGADLYGADLYGADLYGADLYGAYLGGANLRGADLRGADLYGADLRGANLRGANLYGAYLRGANLGGANLRGAGITFDAGPSGRGQLIRLDPEGRYDPDGDWHISIGCWRDHTLDQLRDLIDDKVPWPEAEGAERERRRPYLRAVLALCEAHIAYETAEDVAF